VKLLSRIVLAVVAAIALAFALMNRQPVDLDLGAWMVTIPLYLLLIATLALGVILGGVAGWLGAAPRRRRRTRNIEARVTALERERPPSPPGSTALTSPRPASHMDDD
jgi:uncharacterized integral membrane protein